MNQRRVIPALKVVLWLSALTPITWIAGGLLALVLDVSPVLGDGLGANPTEKMTHVTGMTTLVLLLVTLSVSPIRRFTGWNPVIRLRRPLGLFAFFYASIHFTIWFVFYNVGSVQYMIEDIVERPYITVGFSAFVVLMPLAVTSTKGWIRRLGKKWAKIHMGIYIATTLGVVHFYWLVKADTRLPLLLGACLAVLLILRSPQIINAHAKRKRQSQVRAAAAPSPTN